MGMRYKQDSNDEFQSWLTETILDTETAFIPLKGMKPLRNYSDFDEIGEYAAFILVSDKRDTVYPDEIDLAKGEVRYWGDAKRQEPNQDIDIDNFYGNKRLLPENDKIAIGDTERVAPILLFEKERAGFVRFQGLCVLEDVMVETYPQEFNDRCVWTPNYLFHLGILDVEEVLLTWIQNRVDGNDDGAPALWDRWKQSGKVPEGGRFHATISNDT